MREIGTVTTGSVRADVSPLSSKVLVGMVAATLIARLLVMLVLRSWNFPNHWQFGWEMAEIGASLAEGQGFSRWDAPTAKFPPAYPLVVAGVFAIFGLYTKTAAIALFVINSLCAVVTAVCLGILANRLFGRTAGTIAGFAWAFYPSSLINSVLRIWSSELTVMLLALIITLGVTIPRLPNTRRVVLMGGLGGLLILTDSAVSIYLPLMMIGIVLLANLSPSRRITLITAWLLAVGTVASPWVARNWLTLGTPGLIKSNLGLELFAGNNDFSSGTSEEDTLEKALAGLDQQRLDVYRSQPEAAYFRFLLTEALEWIQSHPGQFLELTLRRVTYFWSVIPKQGDQAFESWLYFVWYGPLVVMGFLGLRQAFRDPGIFSPRVFPLVLLLFIYPLPYYITHVTHFRYRYPVEPILMVLAAGPLMGLLRRIPPIGRRV